MFSFPYFLLHVNLIIKRLRTFLWTPNFITVLKRVYSLFCDTLQWLVYVVVVHPQIFVTNSILCSSSIYCLSFKKIFALFKIKNCRFSNKSTYLRSKSGHKSNLVDPCYKDINSQRIGKKQLPVSIVTIRRYPATLRTAVFHFAEFSFIFCSWNIQ